jgi:hypothetical protein
MWIANKPVMSPLDLNSLQKRQNRLRQVKDESFKYDLMQVVDETPVPDPSDLICWQERWDRLSQVKTEWFRF